MSKKPAKRRSTPKANNSDDTPKNEVEIEVQDAEIVDESVSHSDQQIVESDGPDVASEPEHVVEASPEPIPPVQEATRGASPLWMLLGGLVAGGIGYGIATFQGGFDDTGLNSELSAQKDAIAALQEQIAALPEPADLSGVETSIADLTTQSSDGFSRIDQDIVDLSERMEVVEKQPSADGTLQEAAVAAYQRDIDALRAQIESQQADMAEMMAATTAQLTQTREEAVAIEENAIAKARAATARVALSKVDGAINSGAPFADALAELTDALQIEAPDALSAVSEGVPTLASLQAAFPDVARAALSTARSEGADGEEAGGLTSFLRNQFDVRSVTPQEGNSADAILSRAEAALKEGRLADTMAEVAGLPEVARAALTDWSAMAEARSAAQDAVADLSSQLDVN